MTRRECAHCGAAFKASGKRKYCSDICSWLSKAAMQRARKNGGHIVCWLVFECGQCGKHLGPNKQNDKHRWCSDACRQLASARARGIGVVRRFTPDPIRKPEACLLCGEPCDRGRYCNQHRSIYRPHILQAIRKGEYEKNCCVCGARFCPIPGSGYLTCSDQCKREANRDRKKARRTRLGVSDASRSARARRIRVFHRDDWTCQGCGCKTPRHIMGTTHQDAPELDHIIPVAAGGDHTEGNLQLLCRTCNILKGASPMEEFVSAYINTGV